MDIEEKSKYAKTKYVSKDNRMSKGVYLSNKSKCAPMENKVSEP